MSKSMTRNSLLVALFAAVLCAGVMFGCSSNNTASSSSASSSSSEASSSAATEAVETQYITAEELMDKIDAKDADLLMVDVRKLADYDEGHIDGAITADMDAAKDGDLESGEITMREALAEATGSDTGADKQIVLICYSGNAYAKAGTEVLEAIGADMKNVCTLEGGMKAWNEAYPDTLVKTA